MRYKSEIQDTIWLVGLQGINYLIPLLVWPYLMLTLGDSQFGKIGFGNTMAQLLMLVVDFGFNLTATKRIAQWKAAGESQTVLNRIFSETMACKGILVLLSLLCLAIVELIPQYAPYRWTNLVFFTMVVGQAFSFIWLFQGLGQIRMVSIINAAVRLLILPLTFLLVHGPEDVCVAAAIQGAVYLVAMLVVVVWIMMKHMVGWVPVSTNGIRSTMMEAFPVFLSNATSSVYVLLFVLILGYFTNPATVGCYSAAEKIMRMACYGLLLPVMQAFYPKVSALALENRDEAVRLCRQLCRMILAGMLLIGAALFVLSDYLVLWIDRGYDSLSLLLRILSIVPLFIGLGAVFGQIGLLAIGGEKQKRQFRNVYFIAAAFSLILIVCFSPILTEVYAAIALLCTEALVAVLMGWYYYQSIRKSVKQ